jgi:hypothetical protein
MDSRTLGCSSHFNFSKSGLNISKSSQTERFAIYSVARFSTLMRTWRSSVMLPTPECPSIPHEKRLWKILKELNSVQVDVIYIPVESAGRPEAMSRTESPSVLHQPDANRSRVLTRIQGTRTHMVQKSGRLVAFRSSTSILEGARTTSL